MPGSARPWPSRWVKPPCAANPGMHLRRPRTQTNRCLDSSLHHAPFWLATQTNSVHVNRPPGLQMALDAEMLKKLDAAKMESMVRVAISWQWLLHVISCRRWLLHAGRGSAPGVTGCYAVASMCPSHCFAATCACSRRQQCAWRLGRMMRTPTRARRARRSQPPSPVRSGRAWHCWQSDGGCKLAQLQGVPVSNGHSLQQAERIAPHFVQARCGRSRSRSARRSRRARRW